MIRADLARLSVKRRAVAPIGDWQRTGFAVFSLTAALLAGTSVCAQTAQTAPSPPPPAHVATDVTAPSNATDAATGATLPPRRNTGPIIPGRRIPGPVVPGPIMPAPRISGPPPALQRPPMPDVQQEDPDSPLLGRSPQPMPVRVEGPVAPPPQTLANAPRAPRAELVGAEIAPAGEMDLSAVQAPVGPPPPSTLAPMARVGGPPFSEAPPSATARMNYLVEQCRAASGSVGDGSRVATGADLNGDGIADWVLEEGLFHCPGQPGMFANARSGSNMSVYVGGAPEGSRAAFAHGVYNAAMIEDGGAWTLWGVVGGPMCGQTVTAETPPAEIRRCARAVGVGNRSVAAGFAPLNRAMTETDFNRYLGSRLVGRWTMDGWPSCDTGGALVLNPDGTLTLGGHPGLWAIRTGSLALSVNTPEGIRRYSSKLSRVGVAMVDVRFNAQLDDGPSGELAPAALIRCPAPGATPPPPAPPQPETEATATTPSPAEDTSPVPAPGEGSADAATPTDRALNPDGAPAAAPEPGPAPVTGSPPSALAPDAVDPPSKSTATSP